MKKTITKVFCAVLFLTGTFSAFALDVNGTPPTFTGTGSGDFNTAVSTAFGIALNKVRQEVRDIDSKPDDFIQSWGNSAIFASHGATQRAYGDYKLFSFTTGPMIGLQLPGDPFKIANELDNLADKLNRDHDIKLGVSPQIFNARLGINASKFLLDKLYLGLHLGFIKLKGDDFGLNGFSYDNFSIGVLANYQFIPQIKIIPKILLWRGVNFGSGLIYQGTKINYAIKLETYSADITGSGITGTLSIDPKLMLDMNINTVTIPLEATTAVKLLSFLNIPVGVGVDLGFGKSDIKIGMKGDVYVTGNPGTLTQSKPGNVSVDAGGDMAPSFFNLKFMTGVGINIGPVLLDIPVTFYAGNGYSVGVTVGIVW
ncbi:MAG: hypothetical protein LBC76_01420 [Treponema sp.]|jgi:hypothetical protein|nr:hypothetical protein [Treponema sp.]